jgi:hypothetical protein
MDHPYRHLGVFFMVPHRTQNVHVVLWDDTVHNGASEFVPQASVRIASAVQCK